MTLMTPIPAPAKPHGYYFEDIVVGLTATRSNLVTEQMLVAFADVSGDRNPVHLDDGYAATTVFKERIAHGILSAAFISAVNGMDLPGPGGIYLSQTLNFKAPVRIGDTVITCVTVVELLSKRRVRLSTVCSVGSKIVVDGEAIMMAPRRPQRLG